MAANGLRGRLRTYGFWGQPVPPPLTLNYTSDAAWRKARADGKIQGLRLLSEAEYSGRRRGGETEGGAAHGLTLAHNMVYPAGWNFKAAWQNVLGTPDANFEELPNVQLFGGGAGLAHTDGRAGVPSAYHLTLEAAKIPAGGAWALKLYLYAPAENQSRAMFTIAWLQWRIQIAGGGAEIVRASPDWTGAKELQLYALLQTLEPTASQQGQIDDLRDEIYSGRSTLSIGPGGDNWHNTPLEFVVIPEPAGRVHIGVNNQWQIIEHSEIIESGQYAALWESGPLALRCEGGAYFWQAGYPSALPAGKLQLGPYSMSVFADYVFFNGQTNAISYANGGTVAATNNLLDIANAELQATFAPPADRRLFPFLYHLGLTIPGGARDGGFASGAPTWDSDDYDSPVMDVEPSFEGVHRRAQYNVTFRDPQVINFAAAGANNSHLEHQVCRLDIGGAPAVTNGLVMESEAVDVADPATHRSSTRVRTRICGGWARLDEDIMDDAPIGDGEYIGAHLKLVLRGGGWTNTQLAGIPENALRRLPAAFGGEAPLFMPRDGITRGEYLRTIVEDWGLGWMLYEDIAGVWQFEKPNTAPVAEFGGENGLKIYRQLSLPRELSDYANVIRIQSQDRNGNPLSEDIRLDKSITKPGSRAYIGREIKSLRSVRQVPAARTATDLYWVKRSIYEQFKGAPRFQSFESDYVQNLFPGQYVTGSGVLCRVRSIPGGSIARNRMGLVLQEMA